MSKKNNVTHKAKDKSIKLNKFKSNMFESTEKIIKQYIPIKIIELTELLKELKKNNDKNNKFKQIKKYIEIIKSEVIELINYLDEISLFINLHIPKIEDGNNFGVEVQETITQVVNLSYWGLSH